MLARRFAAADEMSKRGDFARAIRAYVEVAREYQRLGFALKAVAIWKQVREITRRDPEHHAMDIEARHALIDLYRSLGLETDARALIEEITKGANRDSM